MKYHGLSIASILRFRIESHLRIAKYFVQHVVPNRRELGKTASLRAIHRGRSAFVFANGPSLRKLDPHKIARLQQEQGFHVFALSSYITTDFARVVPPDYYVLSDPAHFGYFLERLTEQRRHEVKRDMDSIISGNIPLFMPLQYVKKVAYHQAFPFCDAENFFGSNVADITRARGYLSMTAYKALAIACYLGYEKIYICGIDNNFFKTLAVDGRNNMYYDIEHYYEKGTDAHIRYKVRPDEGLSVGELLYDQHFLFKHLEKFAGFPIVNLDMEGLVDCFSKQHDLDVYETGSRSVSFEEAKGA